MSEPKAVRINIMVFMIGLCVMLVSALGAVLLAGWIWGAPVGWFAFFLLLSAVGYSMVRGS